MDFNDMLPEGISVERSGEYKGYQYAINLAPNCVRDIMILFPKDLDLEKIYGIHPTQQTGDTTPTEKVNNWFSKTMYSILGTNDALVYNTEHGILNIFRCIGLAKAAKDEAWYLIKEEDIKATDKKFGGEYCLYSYELSILRDSLRTMNNTVEGLVDAGDRDGLKEAFNKPIVEVVWYSDDDCVELIEKFIDAYESTTKSMKKHEGLLDKIKNSHKARNKIKEENKNDKE